jgi:hypothetical protein
VQAPYEPADRERLLWLTVLKQAIWDSEGRSEVDHTTIYRAVKWLTKPTHAYFDVCAMAGMEYQKALCLQELQRCKLNTN